MSLKAVLLWFAIWVALLPMNGACVLIGLGQFVQGDHSAGNIALIAINAFFTWWSYVNARQLYRQVLDQLPGEPDSWEEQP